jgi:hypothetical protein
MYSFALTNIILNPTNGLAKNLPDISKGFVLYWVKFQSIGHREGSAIRSRRYCAEIVLVS